MTDETPQQRRQRRRQVNQWYSDLASDLPQGFIVLDAVVALKCLDSDGEVVLVNQRTDSLSSWEAIGMHISASDDLRAALQTPIEDD